MQKYPKVTQLLEPLTERVTTGMYNPYTNSPDYCNPMSACGWELGAVLSRHYHPTVRQWATDTVNTIAGCRGKTRMIMSQCENPSALMRANEGIFHPQTGEMRPPAQLPKKQKKYKNLKNQFCRKPAQVSDFTSHMEKRLLNKGTGEADFKQQFLRSELRLTKEMIAAFRARPGGSA
jgi:hypothetical protein